MVALINCWLTYLPCYAADVQVMTSQTFQLTLRLWKFANFVNFMTSVKVWCTLWALSHCRSDHWPMNWWVFLTIGSHNYIMGPCGAPGHCRISPPRFLTECRKRRLSQGSFVSAVCLNSCLFSLICILFMCVFLWFIVSFFLIVCLSVTIKWLAVKTASEMTYTVSGGALNSTQSNQIHVSCAV